MFRLTAYPRLRHSVSATAQSHTPSFTHSSRWISRSQFEATKINSRSFHGSSIHERGIANGNGKNRQSLFGSGSEGVVGSSTQSVGTPPPRLRLQQKQDPSNSSRYPSFVRSTPWSSSSSSSSSRSSSLLQKSNQYRNHFKPKPFVKLPPRPFSPKKKPSLVQILELLGRHLGGWTKNEETKERLGLYLHGLEETKVAEVLAKFEEVIRREIGELGQAKEEDLLELAGSLGWDFVAIGAGLQHDENWMGALDKAILRRMVSWMTTARKTTSTPLSDSLLPPDIISRLNNLLHITDLTTLPTRSYTDTRELTRHFHLHIGPTNSGKTYSALKSLALAETGTYAGPLRLLAHEVWERMNRGTVGGLQNGQGRECNLITGEERRIVSLDAGITSCTVEMMSSGISQEVVVIDEIQMIGDSSRGSAWTNAILGVQAKEVHLCGEETVIEVIRQLTSSLRDTLTIHRYERLTPLTISNTSLESDISKIRKGDCVVSFSRSGIFAMKKMIEEKTGLRCAVVYGALPPETRAEQAKLFNEEGSGVDVLVASDAVGMGLNLKIKRMIFESLHKFNGKTEVPLSISQVKQIAGRAGRFGQQIVNPDGTSTALGGEVTTLNPEDLPLLRRILPSSLPPVTRAVMEAPFETLVELSLLFPSETPYSTLLKEFSELAKVPSYCVYKDVKDALSTSQLISGLGGDLSLKELSDFSMAPVNVRDDKVVQCFLAYLKAYADEGEVDVMKCLQSSRLVPMLEMVELARKALKPNPGSGSKAPGWTPQPIPPEVVAAIPLLESLHKALVLYIWLSFRFDLAFTQRQEAETLKLRVEESLEECLERMPGLRDGRKRAMGSPSNRLSAQELPLHQSLQSTSTQNHDRPKKINWLSKQDYDRFQLNERYGGSQVVSPTTNSSGRSRNGQQLRSEKRMMSTGKARPHLTLFTGGPECSLCEIAKEQLNEIKQGQDFDLTYFNIRAPPSDVDPYEAKKWRRLYQYDIPVLHLEDKRIQKHRIDTEKLISALESWRDDKGSSQLQE